MSGYQESVTDPSYAGQIIVFTYPLIGNYGVGRAHMESDRIHARAVIMREGVDREDAPHAEGGWLTWLADCGIPALTGVDTRALVRHIRDKGAMRGGVFAAETPRGRGARAGHGRAADGRPRPRPRGHARRAGDPRGQPARAWSASTPGSRTRSCATCASAARAWSCIPCSRPADELLAREPDAVFLANGPGDPAALDYVVDTVRELVGKVPVWGICLGHQLLCRAVGLETFKLPFGHRGANHPGEGPGDRPDRHHVPEPRLRGARARRRAHASTRDEPVRWETDFGAAELQQLNLYDRTVEGLVLRDVPGVDRPVPPRGRARAARRAAPLRPLHGASGGRLMPRRDDIEKILVIGSGPIVIGQAAEFDYSGAQACKVLLEEGYEVVLVNSNPATIMTDPEFATATYIEPLLPDSVARVIERERPDALLPTLGGGTALNLARAAHRGRHARQAPGGADRRRLRRHPPRRGPRPVPRDDGGAPGCGCRAAPPSSRCARRERALPEVGLPAIVRPGFTMGGEGGGIARTETEFRQLRGRGPGRQPDRPGAGRGVGDRLGRVRARGDARPQRQRGDRLLDRERRPDGRAHRRLRHGGAAADALRRPVPGAARPGDRRSSARWASRRAARTSSSRSTRRPTRSW